MRIFGEEALGWLYNLAKHFSGDNIYVHDANIEGSYLFDNDPFAVIKIVQVISSTAQVVNVPIIKVETKRLALEEKHNYVLGNIQGQWSGTIVEREIDGSMFTSIGQNQFVVKKGSMLAEDVRLLFENSQQHRLGKLVRLLQQAEQGFIDDSVRKYIEEPNFNSLINIVSTV